MIVFRNSVAFGNGIALCILLVYSMFYLTFMLPKAASFCNPTRKCGVRSHTLL